MGDGEIDENGTLIIIIIKKKKKPKLDAMDLFLFFFLHREGCYGSCNQWMMSRAYTFTLGCD